jgi:hypothetical protein
MNSRIILGSFATEAQLFAAVRAVQERKWRIVDVYAPYPLHGMEELLGWRRSRLPAACLFSGLVGVGFALWFQFWTTAQDWPINVGGRPWNSLPAFLPVAFEMMVLFAGFGVVLAWLIRCGLYPGNSAHPPMAGLTDSQFALAVQDPGVPTGPDAVRQLLHECMALALEEQAVEDSQS